MDGILDSFTIHQNHWNSKKIRKLSVEIKNEFDMELFFSLLFCNIFVLYLLSPVFDELCSNIKSEQLTRKIYFVTAQLKIVPISLRQMSVEKKTSVDIKIHNDSKQLECFQFCGSSLSNCNILFIHFWLFLVTTAICAFGCRFESNADLNEKLLKSLEWEQRISEGLSKISKKLKNAMINIQTRCNYICFTNNLFLLHLIIYIRCATGVSFPLFAFSCYSIWSYPLLSTRNFP